MHKGSPQDLHSVAVAKMHSSAGKKTSLPLLEIPQPDEIRTTAPGEAPPSPVPVLKGKLPRISGYFLGEFDQIVKRFHGHVIAELV